MLILGSVPEGQGSGGTFSMEKRLVGSIFLKQSFCLAGLVLVGTISLTLHQPNTMYSVLAFP